MIYLDSAATSLQKPSAVKQAVLKAMGSMASPGRGGHPPAMAAAECVYQCRMEAAALFAVEEAEQVVFTSNASHALNLAIHSLIRPGQRVLMSGFEHNAVSRPLAVSGANVRVVGRELFDADRVLQDFTENLNWADAVVCTQVSNVFGFVLPIEEISSLCRARGIPLIVDAAQSAGILDVNMKKWGAAFVAMPGHKGLMGPQGTGILLCNHETIPLLYGGSGSDSRLTTMPDYLPDRLEAGTHNIPGIAGLFEGIRYVRRLGVARILQHEQRLLRLAIHELSGAPLELFCGPDQIGLLSVRSPELDCESLAARLGQAGICVRAGLHCAPIAHESAGTLDTGTLRISFSPFLRGEEVIGACRKLKSFFR